MMKKTAFTLFTALFMIFVLLTGTVRTYAGSGIVLDVSENPVYQSIEADTIINVFNINPDSCKKLYDGKYCLIYGKVVSVAGGYCEVVIAGGSGSTSTRITCTSKNAIASLKGMSAGNYIKVYGKIEVSTFWNVSVEVEMHAAEAAGTATVNENVFSTINGNSVNRYSMVNRSTVGGGLKYAIPASWVEVESELPNANGYQYKLNDLTGKGIAESVFVFYVDGSYLEDPSDISKTTKVRKAIVSDILCNAGLKMYSSLVPLFDRDITISTSKSTDYASYVYYTGNYREQNINRYNHRVEFAFIEDEDSNGVSVVLYVYNNPEHVDDILLMMRTINR